MEKRLFDLLHGVGELLEGKIHIIDQTDRRCSDPDKIEYRTYHSDGYCFDIYRERMYCDEDKELFDGEPQYDYYFGAEWEGFKDLNEKEAFGLVCFLRTEEERKELTEQLEVIKLLDNKLNQNEEDE
jgi:hypothetical protein